jgi:hypothetical protein
MSIDKPVDDAAFRQANGISNNSAVRFTGTLQTADGHRFYEDYPPSKAPDFSSFKWSSEPIKRLLFDASQQQETVTREYHVTDFHPSRRGRNTSMRSVHVEEQQNGADLAWFGGGSALSELMNLSKEKQQALLSVEGGGEMILRNPRDVLQSVQKVQQETGQTMTKEDSLKNKLGERLPDVKGIAMTLGAALKGDATYAGAKQQPSGRDRGI